MKTSTLWIVSFGAIALVTMTLWRPSRDEIRSVAPSRSTHVEAPAAAPAPSSFSTASTALQGEAPALPELADAAALDGLLADISREALERGELRPEDERLGAAAIESMLPKLGPGATAVRARRFAIEMRNLKKRIELAPVQAELAELATQLRTETDAAKRSAALEQYRAKASTLPQVYRLGALDALREATGPAHVAQLQRGARPPSTRVAR